MSGRLTPPPEGRRWLIVLALLVLAGLVRLSAIFYHEVASDDAMVGLMARHILSGQAFPAFSYGQIYLGSLGAVLLVPPFYLFGPTALVLRVSAVVYSLLFPFGLYLLGRRVFDEATARAALLLAAVPPFPVTLWSTRVAPNFMASVLCMVLLLIAVAAKATGPRYARLLACFGLVAGVAGWTHFAVLEVLVPTLAVLWIRDPQLPFRQAGASLVGGLAVGSLPMWAWYATYGDPTGSARQLFQPELGLVPARLTGVLQTFQTLALGGYLWPPATLIRGVAGFLSIAIYLAACGAALFELRGHRDAASRRSHGVWLLLLTLVTAFAGLYVARRVTFQRDTIHYVLPAYIPLLLLAAAFVIRMWRWSRVVGAGFLAFLLAYNVWTTWPALWPFHPSERAGRAVHMATLDAIERHLETNRTEALYLEARWSSLHWAFLLRGVRASDLSGELYLPNAMRADAARRIAILLERRADAVLQALDTLGATYRTTAFGESRLLEEIRVPSREYRLVPRASWRVRTEGVSPSAVADGDLATAWLPNPADAAHAVVNLGRGYDVGRIIWWPAPDDPRSLPLAVSLSRDGRAWDPVGVQPGADRERRPAFVAAGRPVFRPGNAWLEARFAARRVRFIRFAPAEPATTERWGIAELYAYEDTGPGAERDLGTDVLMALPRARGLRRLLADPVTSARVAQAAGGALRTFPMQLVVDNDGRPTPAARLTRPVALEPTDGLLVPAEDAEDLRVRLAAKRVEFREDAAGDAVLFYGLSPVPDLPTQWAWAGRTLFVYSGPPRPD